jgi:hypothetical protein
MSGLPNLLPQFPLRFAIVLPYFPSLNMSAHPRHSNANVHPAQVLLNSTTKRRTSAQVKADNEEAAAASASAVKAEAQNKLRRVLVLPTLRILPKSLMWKRSSKQSVLTFTCQLQTNRSVIDMHTFKI